MPDRGVPGLGGAWSRRVPAPGGMPGLGDAWWRLSWMATAAGCMHPTGMHSWFLLSSCDDIGDNINHL